MADAVSPHVATVTPMGSGGTVVFDGHVHVSYSQFYVFCRGAEFETDYYASYYGQRNGLCGAADPGGLFLTTGTHTGPVPLRVETHASLPEVGPEWEEVVEVSFDFASTDVTILGWAGDSSDDVALPATGTYRIRYCANGLDEAHDRTAWEEDPARDRYLIQLWPAPPAPDVVLRQTSANAAYWHGCPATIDPAFSYEAREAERSVAAEREAEREAELDRQRSTSPWGLTDDEVQHGLETCWPGHTPSPRLVEVLGPAPYLQPWERDLVHDFAALTPAQQRTTASWLARRAAEIAEMDQWDWVAPALTALDEGRPLPAPFDEPGGARQRLSDQEDMSPGYVVVTTTSSAPRPLTGAEIYRPAFAIPAIEGAAHEDPLMAVIDAARHAVATYADEAATLEVNMRLFMRSLG